MDILAIAEENFLITLSITIGIGLLQGAILGRGIRNRFPSFKRHARIGSIILLTLFSINAIANVLKFAIPEKISVSELIIPSTPEEGLSLLFTVFGLNAGLGTVIATFVSISLILFLKSFTSSLIFFPIHSKFHDKKKKSQKQHMDMLVETF